MENSCSLLFIVNGLGMGNSTRCYAVIQKLHALGIEADVATSNNGLTFFEKKSEVCQVFEIESFHYGKKNGRLSMSATLAGLPKMISAYFKNYRHLRSLVRTLKPAAIVIDSEYGYFPTFDPTPVFAINNADVIVQKFFALKKHPSSLWPQFLLAEWPDHLFHLIFPAKTISPAIEQGRIVSRKIVRVPPIVREGIVPTPAHRKIERIALMLSCSNFAMSIDPETFGLDYRFDVIGKSGTDTARVKYHGRLLDNLDLLKAADILVVNGGFSAVSEALALRKPVVVVPVPHHAEQFINAKGVEALGLGLMAAEAEVGEKIKQIISNYETILQNHARCRIPSNGAELAARVIVDHLRNRGLKCNPLAPTEKLAVPDPIHS